MGVLDFVKAIYHQAANVPQDIYNGLEHLLPNQSPPSKSQPQKITPQQLKQMQSSQANRLQPGNVDNQLNHVISPYNLMKGITFNHNTPILPPSEMDITTPDWQVYNSPDGNTSWLEDNATGYRLPYNSNLMPHPNVRPDMPRPQPTFFATPHVQATPFLQDPKLQTMQNYRSSI